MGSVVLCLPLLFFLHCFHPKAALMMIPAVAMTFWSGHSEYDDWLIDLTIQYTPPNGKILVINGTEDTTLAINFSVEDWESVPYPEMLRNQFGLVIMEKLPEPISTHRLEYIFNVLVYGGKLIIVDGRKVIMVITKNGK